MADLHDILMFYRDAGADVALDEAPVNRFAAPPSPHSQPVHGKAPSTAEPPRGRQPQAPAPALQVPDESQAALARELAAKAESLEELHNVLAGFEGCNLKFTAKKLVFADGTPEGPLMVIGEAPGRDEDIEGLPFVGRSGQLLDRILAAIGLDRSRVYVANVIPWRPPGNRAPTPHETEICRPFIMRQIELARPAMIMTLGGPASKVLLNTTEGIMRMRGRWSVHKTPSGIEIPAMPTLHPAYLLRNPAHKRLVWRDMLEVKTRLIEMGQLA